MPSSPGIIYDDIIGEKACFANYSEINESGELNIGNMKLSFCKTDHPVETYAVKISDGSMDIVYTSDTSFSAKSRLVDFAKNADLLICESSLLESHGFPEINSHLTAKQAGIIAKEANVQGLILTHFWPEEAPENYVSEAKNVFSRVIAAKEGLIIDFSRKYKKELDIR